MENKPKYKNKKAYRDANGEQLEFDSGLEARRFDHLYLLLRGKKIRKLTLQKKFIVFDGFRIRGKKIRDITYTVDFTYERYENEKWVSYADDAKGVLTEPTKLKQKMFLQRFGDEYVGINSSYKKVWTEKVF